MGKLTYKEEGLRRMKLRKEARNEEYRRKVQVARDTNRPFSVDAWGCWADPDSPTGYSQMCEWPTGSTCQSPCNGDC